MLNCLIVLTVYAIFTKKFILYLKKILKIRRAAGFFLQILYKNENDWSKLPAGRRELRTCPEEGDEQVFRKFLRSWENSAGILPQHSLQKKQALFPLRYRA